ncbi:MAG: PAS domain-containing protein [Acidimicrobiia bacterium]|nr:PAS domain-containing protein [Acidimicrobiia bacterium]
MAVAIVAVGVVLLVAVVGLLVLDRRRRAATDQCADLETELERMRARAVASATHATALREALDAIPLGVIIGDRTGTVIYRNPAAALFLDARHGEALVEVAIRELIGDAIQGERTSRSLELFGPPRRVLEVQAVPLGDAGTGAGTGGLIVVEDVSDRRRLEAIRRDFVANISHELKTPVGALGLLAETLLGEDDPEVTHPLAERMVAEAFRVNRTIDDLLELSRIEAGEAPVRQPVLVQQVLDGAADRIRPAATLRSIEVVVEPGPLGLTVMGDRRQLVSAMFNLLDNAVKYSEPDHVVTLRSSAVCAEDGSAWAELAVVDQGMGIPARDLERVFERFYRVDRARSRGTGGTGLGLAIVRHVAGNHHGDVSVESQEGSGSTFRLRLPAALANEEAQAG